MTFDMLNFLQDHIEIATGEDVSTEFSLIRRVVAHTLWSWRQAEPVEAVDAVVKLVTVGGGEGYEHFDSFEWVRMVFEPREELGEEMEGEEMEEEEMEGEEMEGEEME